jgi:hypothetical protein
MDASTWRTDLDVFKRLRQELLNGTTMPKMQRRYNLRAIDVYALIEAAGLTWDGSQKRYLPSCETSYRNGHRIDTARIAAIRTRLLAGEAMASIGASFHKSAEWIYYVGLRYGLMYDQASKQWQPIPVIEQWQQEEATMATQTERTDLEQYEALLVPERERNGSEPAPALNLLAPGDGDLALPIPDSDSDIDVALDMVAAAARQRQADMELIASLKEAAETQATRQQQSYDTIRSQLAEAVQRIAQLETENKHLLSKLKIEISKTLRLEEDMNKRRLLRVGVDNLRNLLEQAA